MHKEVLVVEGAVLDPNEDKDREKGSLEVKG